ncbi:hypothetical protein SLEP1_g20248 [Rubroshorea leprosula]|uniref:Uncharacterized protein n=1 Tax=Rubroshorea leprosula TaxID=152421 RepID=A0AAV5J223_9ROSI|nr:hypothetical protein SLEP1_g20248 [Rubroshorea leprosula]
MHGYEQMKKIWLKGMLSQEDGTRWASCEIVALASAMRGMQQRSHKKRDSRWDFPYSLQCMEVAFWGDIAGTCLEEA